MRGLALAALLFTAPAAAQAPAASPTYAAPDYTQDANWLCRPGRADACGGELAATAVAGDGKTSVVALPTAKAPKIDCFYVYPTVSTDQTGNSDLSIDTAETNVARIQFAPFRSVCRTFAPMYRQVTLKALRDILLGQASNADRIMAYRDVVAAWNDYLARDNQGRGVLLIGHSQGSGVLKALLQNEIEGKPVARQIIAAYIPGNNVLVPAGKDVGGDLKSTPLCHSAADTGCVLAWVSYRDGKVPPADARFGRSPTPGLAVACTNPAALGGGRAPLRMLLPTATNIVDNASGQSPWAKGAVVTTPFVALPGLLSGACVDDGGAQRLAIRTDADPADARTDTLGGDVMFAGQVVESWGLHLIDVNAVLGDLVALAEAQGQAWEKKGR
ncbi:MAG: lysophospholipase [Alphaproteobacteria bacterium PA4]|nr:MAG: lysophospholipase [Alphaproteobacteria bacterium PA4]